VEARVRSKPSSERTHRDYLELGVARQQVWSIYNGRSRYPAYRRAARREAAWNRRKARRRAPSVLEAFERAMAQPPDPRTAARAKLWLAQFHAEARDLDKEIAMLRRILAEHADMEDPTVFGLGGTPHYYCYYTLVAAHQAKGERAEAVEALAQALLAVDARAKAGVEVGDRPAHVLGLLLDYEPRVVLPQYRRLLPPGTDDFLRHHEASAPTRITLTVARADRDALVVRYRVVFPDYPAVIKAWEEEQKRPYVRLPDDFSHLKPAFGLRFFALPATPDFAEPSTPGFAIPEGASLGLAPRQATPLSFDDDATASGEIALRWSDDRPKRVDFYLTAKLVRSYMRGRSLDPGQGTYVRPVRVTLSRDREARKRP